MLNKLLKISALSATDTVETLANGEISTITMSFSERLSYCIEKILIGLIIIFGVLAIIWIVLALFKVFFNKNSDAKDESAGVVKETEVASSVVKADELSASSGDEVVAAIIAAITAARCESGEATPGGFRVVSFKRTGKARPWNY